MSPLALTPLLLAFFACGSDPAPRDPGAGDPATDRGGKAGKREGKGGKGDGGDGGDARRGRSEPTPTTHLPEGGKEHAEGGNVLLVVMDDVGLDKVRAYGIAQDAPPTPTLSRLADEGRRFDHVWVEPMCSPSRSAIMTGRYPRRTGLGMIIDSWKDEYELENDEMTIAEMLARAPGKWSTSFVGKWHLSSTKHDILTAPGRQGFEWYSFTTGNLKEPFPGDKRADTSYRHWNEVVNGRRQELDGYATKHHADVAVERMKAMPEPWFTWVAFNAAHLPLDPPPAEYGDPPRPDAPEHVIYDAVLTAMDREIGRMLDAMGPLRERTTVIVIGDNGTPDHAIRPPFDPEDGKGSVMELGVRVPMFVTGPLVKQPGTASKALVAGVDLFATIADLAGVGDDKLEKPIDGVTLLPILADPSASVRETVWTEKFKPNGFGPYHEDKRAVRDHRYKLVVDDQKGVIVERLFDLQDLDYERNGGNLLRDGVAGLTPHQKEAYDKLKAEHDRIASNR